MSFKVNVYFVFALSCYSTSGILNSLLLTTALHSLEILFFLLTPANLPAILSFVQTSSTTSTSNKKSCLAINKEGRIIQTYKTIFSSHYRIGKLSKDGDEVDWIGRDTLYSSGKYSKIQLDDKGTVVETFQLNYPRRCFYSIGRLNIDCEEIEWISNPFAFASGGKPSVALNNKGTVLVTFEKGSIQTDSYYGIGSVDETSGIISWQTGFVKFHFHCSDISLALNDHGNAVFSVRTYRNSYIFLIGKIDSNNSSIKFWSTMDPSSELGPCSYASVALNKSGNVIWIKAQQRRVIVVTGRMIQSYHTEDYTLDCNLKLNSAILLNRSIHCPSSCISNSDVVGFTCHVKRRFFRHDNTVFLCVGTMMPENSLEFYQTPNALFLPV